MGEKILCSFVVLQGARVLVACMFHSVDFCSMNRITTMHHNFANFAKEIARDKVTSDECGFFVGW